MWSEVRATARVALGPALIAGALAVVAALALRYIFGGPMPAELFADQATARVPLPVFEALLATFGEASKHLYLISALVAQAALTALVGLLYLVARQRLAQVWRTLPTTLIYADIPLIAVALWLLSAGALAPLLGGGFLGAGLVGGVGRTLLSQVAPNLVFAGAFYWQLRAAAGGLTARIGQTSAAE